MDIVMSHVVGRGTPSQFVEGLDRCHDAGLSVSADETLMVAIESLDATPPTPPNVYLMHTASTATAQDLANTALGRQLVALMLLNGHFSIDNLLDWHECPLVKEAFHVLNAEQQRDMVRFVACLSVREDKHVRRAQSVLAHMLDGVSPPSDVLCQLRAIAALWSLRNGSAWTAEEIVSRYNMDAMELVGVLETFDKERDCLAILFNLANRTAFSSLSELTWPELMRLAKTLEETRPRRMLSWLATSVPSIDTPRAQAVFEQFWNGSMERFVSNWVTNPIVQRTLHGLRCTNEKSNTPMAACALLLNGY